MRVHRSLTRPIDDVLHLATAQFAPALGADVHTTYVNRNVTGTESQFAPIAAAPSRASCGPLWRVRIRLLDPPRMTGSRGVWVVMMALVAGCLPPWWHVPPLDPRVTFAAHRESRGLVIDRLSSSSDGPAELVAAGSPWDPAFRLEQRHGPAAIISSRNGRAAVRTEGASSSLLGQVDAELDDGAIRLTLQPGPGEVVRTTVFHRLGGGQGEALGRSARSVLEVRGEYRADLKDASGALIGWLRVRVGKYQPYPRIYDGVVPSSVNGALVVAATQMLDAEIDHIEASVPSDVYL